MQSFSEFLKEEVANPSLAQIRRHKFYDKFAKGCVNSFETSRIRGTVINCHINDSYAQMFDQVLMEYDSLRDIVQIKITLPSFDPLSESDNQGEVFFKDIMPKILKHAYKLSESISKDLGCRYRAGCARSQSAQQMCFVVRYNHVMKEVE